MSFPLDMRRFHPVIFNKFIKESLYIKIQSMPNEEIYYLIFPKYPKKILMVFKT